MFLSRVVHVCAQSIVLNEFVWQCRYMYVFPIVLEVPPMRVQAPYVLTVNSGY